MDERFRFQPDLAKSWERVDELTYLFHLRRGVTFHNGKPLTSADVKFTYESVLHPMSALPKRGGLRWLDAVDAVGPYTVRFRLTTPHAPFLENSTLGIVPADSPVQWDWKGGKLLGSGPFFLEKYVPDEKIILKANPSYWGGTPKVSGLVFKIIPDAIVRVLEFKKGEIHFLQNDIEPDIIPWLKRKTNASISIRQGTIFQYMGINLNHPILRRRGIREAIAHAIDREAIIRHLLKGLALPATGLLSPLHWAYEPAVKRYSYDPEKAKRLLDRSGFEDPDGEGPRPRFKLSFKTTTLDIRRRIAEVIKEQLKQVGIELEIQSHEWGTFYGDIKKGRFHLYSLAWVGIADPDIYFTIFHSQSIPPSGDNRGRYQSPAADRLLEAGRTSLDQDDRRRIYSKVQKILAADLPYIPLWWVKNVVVTTPTLRGFVPYPDGSLNSLKDVTFRPVKTAS
ncbi:MAG: ABC transporter substrate-binding protein [Candidatus Binatia bacterium]|nr:ABC transporter substrate-binding protein [Candidatus Binatia bacterium]